MQWRGQLGRRVEIGLAGQALDQQQQTVEPAVGDHAKQDRAFQLDRILQQRPPAGIFEIDQPGLGIVGDTNVFDMQIAVAAAGQVAIPEQRSCPARMAAK